MVKQEVIAKDSRSERGASMVEYALLVALIAVVAIGAVTLLGQNVSGQLNEAARGIGAAPAAPPAN
jgi:pilus assembly protein Flp/PilA